MASEIDVVSVFGAKLQPCEAVRRSEGLEDGGVRCDTASVLRKTGSSGKCSGFFTLPNHELVTTTCPPGVDRLCGEACQNNDSAPVPRNQAEERRG